MASTSGIRAGRAFVELFTEDSRLVRGLRRAEKKLKAFGASVRNLGLKTMGLGAAVIAPLAGAAKYFSSYGDQVAKMAKRTGLSTETLSELRFVASQTGTEFESLEMGFRKMQRSIYDAGRGLSTQVDALTDLGLKFEDLDGLSPEAQFKLLADRIGQIEDPTKKAAIAMTLFGRTGTNLLPMFAAGSKGIEALQAEARALGLTMTGEDAKAAEDFTDALDKLWKVVKMGVFNVGAALAPVLQEIAETITSVIVRVNTWIRQNRQVIVTVLKIAAIVTAVGGALVGLGFIISGLGAVIGGLITVVTTVGSVLGVLASVISFLVTPIGAVIAAVVALGAYLIHVTGAGGKALSWLGEEFTALRDDAMKAIGGISDALVAGDIGLAAQILWNTLKLWWLKGTEGLRRVWIEFKAGFVKLFASAFYGALKAARKVWEWLEIGWAETTAFFSKLWQGFVGFFYETWERMKAAAQKAWNWIRSLFDDSVDLEAENRLVEQKKQEAISRIEDETQRKQAAREAERQARRQEIDAEANAFYQRQDEQRRLLQQAADEIAGEEHDALTQRIAELRKQRDDAIAEARRKREAHDAEKSDDALPSLGDLQLQLDDVGDTLTQTVERTIEVRGTFNAAAIQGLVTSGGAVERTADATEETARNTKRIEREIKTNGLAFA